MAIANSYLVSSLGEDLAILKWQRQISKAEALELAAWLIAMGAPSDDDDAALTLEKVFSMVKEIMAT